MSVGKTAPEALRILWGEDFFLEEKTIDEVIDALHKKGYNFGYDPTRMALKRTSFLSFSGKRGERRYIQRYPFVKETKSQ